MKSVSPSQSQSPQYPAWLTAAVIGIAAPTFTIVVVAGGPSPETINAVGAPILALGLMGVGMIAAATVGHLWVGVVLGLVNAACLIFLARALGLPPVLHPLSTVFAFLISSISFAARGALFARSALDRGWLIALFVVAGEAAILITAFAIPGALPDWLLVLLPAQWASVAIQSSLSGAGTLAALPVLLALACTAAATLLVAQLWPRRWPYMMMFTTWLSMSAVVWYSQSPPT